VAQVLTPDLIARAYGVTATRRGPARFDFDLPDPLHQDHPA
jgi:iron complex transport system ATP-binding protein